MLTTIPQRHQALLQFLLGEPTTVSHHADACGYVVNIFEGIFLQQQQVGSSPSCHNSEFAVLVKEDCGIASSSADRFIRRQASFDEILQFTIEQK